MQLEFGIMFELKRLLVRFFFVAAVILGVYGGDFDLAASTDLSSSKSSSPNVEKTAVVPPERSSKAPGEDLLLASALDGSLYGISKSTGDMLWTLQEEPVLRVPTDISDRPSFLPDPRDGSLYTMLRGESSEIRKLPFTIPQLVSASPCRSSDGILYSGSKKDVWFAIDPTSGRKLHTLSHDTPAEQCPATPSDNHLYIARTEYVIAMFDAKNNRKRWNATFSDYSSHLLPEEGSTYNFFHFASSSTGRVVTFDSSSGEIAWVKEYASPIIAIYEYASLNPAHEAHGLRKVPFATVAGATLNRVGGVLRDQTWLTRFAHLAQRKVVQDFRPTLFVGEYAHGFYAVPALADRHAVSIAPKDSSIVFLIEGNNTATPAPGALVNFSLTRYGLVLGHHELPSRSPTKLLLPPSTSRPSLAPPTHQPATYRYPPDGWLVRDDLDDDLVFGIKSHRVLLGIVIVLFTATTGLLVMIFFSNRRVAARTVAAGASEGDRLLNARSAGTSIGSVFEPLNNKPVQPEGWISVGKIAFDPKQILGRGCEGTFVYRGTFESRAVAVKRMLPECIEWAEREVELLRESDQHPNVIRYYCTESDAQFQYIALELCAATLTDFVEKVVTAECLGVRPGHVVEPRALLKQATSGLAHLHRLGIVHRDVKPANVLLRPSADGGQPLVRISDFGLCKKLAPGRHSWSRRSGATAGTEGWMAPEVLLDQRTTCSVDVFSLGCVFFYVLSCGFHPFGDPLSRQSNIAFGRCCLQKLDALQPNVRECAEDVVSHMLHSAPSHRPSSASILRHPLFWQPDFQLQFLSDASDRVDKVPPAHPLLLMLDGHAQHIIGDDWRASICLPLQTDLRKFRTYRGDSVLHLIRAMRNKKNHYHELPHDVKASLGRIPDEFVAYWTSRFPRLLMHTYNSFWSCRFEPAFVKYYPDDDSTSLSSDS